MFLNKYMNIEFFWGVLYLAGADRNSYAFIFIDEEVTGSVLSGYYFEFDFKKEDNWKHLKELTVTRIKCW